MYMEHQTDFNKLICANIVIYIQANASLKHMNLM